METRVTYRTSEETVKRLQELSDKYGVSQSALLTMLVNERWLAETAPRKTPAIVSPIPREGMDPEPPPNFPNDYGQPVSGKKKKRRHGK